VDAIYFHLLRPSLRPFGKELGSLFSILRDLFIRLLVVRGQLLVRLDHQIFLELLLNRLDLGIGLLDRLGAKKVAIILDLVNEGPRHRHPCDSKQDGQRQRARNPACDTEHASLLLCFRAGGSEPRTGTTYYYPSKVPPRKGRGSSRLLSYQSWAVPSCKWLAASH